MHVDFDPLQIKDANYVESVKCLMVEAIESFHMIMEVYESEHAEKVQVIYPSVEEELLDFLNRCKLKGSKVYDKKIIEGLEKTKPQPSKGENGPSRGQISFNKRGIPYRIKNVATGYKLFFQQNVSPIVK